MITKQLFVQLAQHTSTLSKRILCALLFSISVSACADGTRVDIFGTKINIPSEYIFNIKSLHGAEHFYNDENGVRSSIYLGKIDDCSFCKNEKGLNKQMVGCLGDAIAYTYSKRSDYSDYISTGTLFHNKHFYMVIVGENDHSKFWEKDITKDSCK